MSIEGAGSNQRFLSATTHTVAWFWKRYQSDELVLQPPFQRNAVWQDKQKAALIDTILRGYPIPELYLQTLVDDLGDEQHIVVDGQQRIRACVEFLNNRFSLDEEAGALSGATFEQLSPDQKKQVFEYKFVVRELPPLSEPELREIFGRLNRNNVALNPQELRHATYWGDFISSMTQISQADFWVTSGLFTVKDIRRMSDVEYISEIAVARLYGLQNKKNNLDKYYQAFESEFPDRTQIESEFATVLGELSQIFDWPTKTRWNKKSDFYTLFLVLAKRSQDLPFDRETRTQLNERLKEFSDAVGAYLVGTAPTTEIVQARGYARGVRASSDLGSRRMRATGLESYLFDIAYEPPAEIVQDIVDAAASEDEDGFSVAES